MVFIVCVRVCVFHAGLTVFTVHAHAVLDMMDMMLNFLFFFNCCVCALIHRLLEDGRLFSFFVLNYFLSKSHDKHMINTVSAHMMRTLGQLRLCAQVLCVKFQFKDLCKNLSAHCGEVQQLIVPAMSSAHLCHWGFMTDAHTDIREKEISDIQYIQYFIYIISAECGYQIFVTKICNGGRIS